MHELAVTRSILEIALRHAGQAKRIARLNLVVGDLSSIVDDSVQYYWDLVAAGTPAEDARLHFRRVPAEFSCMVCRQRFTPGPQDLACPGCGSTGVKVEHGEEFYVESIEVDD